MLPRRPSEQRDRITREQRQGDLVYASGLGSIGLIWAQGASETFTREDCERELDRYAKAILALPGGGPWNNHAYPYNDTQKMEAE